MKKRTISYVATSLIFVGALAAETNPNPTIEELTRRLRAHQDSMATATDVIHPMLGRDEHGVLDGIVPDYLDNPTIWGDVIPPVGESTIEMYVAAKSGRNFSPREASAYWERFVETFIDSMVAHGSTRAAAEKEFEEALSGDDGKTILHIWRTYVLMAIERKNRAETVLEMMGNPAFFFQFADEIIAHAKDRVKGRK